MPDALDYLVVGLGNPGAPYAHTRHNAGFMTVDEIGLQYAINFQHRKFESVFGRGKVNKEEVLLAKPQAYMNRSGPPVQSLANYYRISTKRIIVIHDDLDLAFGKLKIKEKGGHGGHNGVRSIIDALGTGEFARVRIGIGRAAGTDKRENDATCHVLGRFTEEEKSLLPRIIETACSAMVTVVSQGTREGMNRFNNTLIQA